MAQRTARIIRDEEVMGGEPVIEETRITVLRVHALVHERGLPPEEIAAMHDLSTADVAAALEYYEQNPETIEEVESWREEAKRRSLESGAKTLENLRREHTEDSDELSGSR